MADIDMITLGIRQSTINDNYDPLADVNEQQSTADSQNPESLPKPKTFVGRQLLGLLFCFLSSPIRRHTL